MDPWIKNPKYKMKIIRQENPYNQPERVLKEMNLSGGIVNRSCINVLWRVEELEKYGQDGYMVTKNATQKVQEMVHKYIDIAVPYNLIEDNAGVDGIQFNYKNYLLFYYKCLSLTGLPSKRAKFKF